MSWRSVIGYEGLYEVSNLGQVRALPKKYRPSLLVLKPQIDYRGYRTVGLTKDRKERRFKISFLVLEAFREPRPYGMEVDHRDRDRGNDTLKNLRWSTRLGNVINRGRFMKSSSNGVPGVSWYTNNQRLNSSSKWRGHAKIDGKLRHVGYFDSIDEASKAVQKFKKGYK